MTNRVNERRRSRESFTKVLSRICARLEADNPLRIAWRSELLPEPHQQSLVRVRSLWVAGSYARGARSCADLDLIADAVIEEGLDPGPPDISRALRNRARDVSLFVGTPQKNSAGIPFPEAKLVWSITERDWQRALAGIVVDPHATHFARRIDALPFRAAQLGVEDPAALERLVELRDKQIIDWDFIPVEAITVNEAEWPLDVREFAEQGRWSKKTQEVMRLAIDYLSRREPFLTWRSYGDKSRFGFGGTEVCVGRPRVPVGLLDELSCSALVLAPHLTHRGPNGLWIIQRGEQHPVEQAFRDRFAYYLKEDGRPLITREEDGGHSADTLEFFAERTDATERAAEEYENFGVACEVASTSGHGLLHLISKVDVVYLIGTTHFALTSQGQQFTKEIEITAEPPDLLAAALPQLSLI